MYWMSAGMLEGSLRALEHAKEKAESQIELIQKVHREEMSKLQSELQDVVEAAETFEKEAQMNEEKRQVTEKEFQEQKASYEEQLKNLEQEN